jgi:hypothetical protein
MLPTHIEQSPPPYNPLGGSPTRMRGRPSTARPHTSRQPSCCSAMLLQLIRCFRSHEQEYLGPRCATVVRITSHADASPAALQLCVHLCPYCCCRSPRPHSRQQQPPLDTPAAQYQAPALTPSPRAASTSSCDDDDGGAEGERGTLLPKVRAACCCSCCRASGDSAAAADAACSTAGWPAAVVGRHAGAGLCCACRLYMHAGAHLADS